MLILTRKKGQRVEIGDDIAVIVLGIHAKQIFIEVRAPAGVVLHSEESQQRFARGATLPAISAGQRLAIGADVTVAFFGVHAHQARLGIQAPRHIPVHRDEVADRIRAGVPRHQAGANREAEVAR